MYKQGLGTFMDTKCAPPYVCVTIGFKEKEAPFSVEPPQYFSLVDIQIIK